VNTFEAPKPSGGESWAAGGSVVLPETDGAKVLPTFDQVGLHLASIHQMAPPEHTSDRQAFYSNHIGFLDTQIYTLISYIPGYEFDGAGQCISVRKLGVDQ